MNFPYMQAEKMAPKTTAQYCKYIVTKEQHVQMMKRLHFLKHV